MSFKFPNGAVYGFATVLASGVLASAISNAQAAVATVPADSVNDGEVVVAISNWPTLTNRVGVADKLTATTVALTGLDTRDVSEFPAGAGAGRLLLADDFVEFSQQGEPSTSGGDQQFWTGQLLEDRSGRQIQIPTFKNAKVYTLPLYYDPSLPWYAAAKAADRKKEPVILRVRLPDGDALYYYGYLSFDGDPTMQVNTPMGNTMTFTSISEPTLVEAA
ncbi:phage tail protein [Pseudoxanthomonas winnipegensis]|uniref:Phage tail protein n=1 Tax=Pseudoxanthomonas winnipegensis TaxID=2480810 RepID=A0ABY1WCP9_9GAMM|nr:phage tail protein [Pseudoxanthomonas winnipegensis]TAA12478.1 phage tail protein [Pseudoxanthomonas winnipegensis]TAA19157.1 phage tail protein [Pseudoxanthomonas winnipegensis]TAH70418.1 phage tail protein [Pseudoxanthomonas winnipegensis]